MDKGYEQAVENLAYVIDQTATRTLDPIVEEHGLVPMDVANALLSEDDQAAWEEVESVSQVICATYGVDYDTLMADVSACLMMNLLAHDLGVH
mgnify:FL=1